MGYIYGNFNLRNIDASGTDLLPATALTILPFPPTIVRNTAIGNRIIISFNLTAFGGDNFNNKKVRVNLKAWGANDISGIESFGYESQGFIDAVLTEGFFVGSPSPFANALLDKNLKARFQRIDAITAYVEIELYITCDFSRWVAESSGGNNFDRFLRALVPNPELTNGGNTVYFTQKELGIKSIVFNSLSGFSYIARNPADATQVIRIPFESRWYNSWFLGSTTGIRFIENFEVTSPSQIASGLAYLAKATATGPQAPTQNVDATYTIPANQAMQLSVNELNTVTIRLKGLVNPTLSPNPATTDVRAILIRTNPLSNTLEYVTDLLLNDAVLPAVAGPPAQLDGAIWEPASWADTAPDILDVTLTIDGFNINFGDTYRIIINTYDSVNSRTTSHISPALVANFTPPVTPTITGELGTYNKVFTGNELSGLAPHSRFKSRITIDKSNYDAQLAGLGILGDFDTAFVRASCELLSNAGEPTQAGNYYKSTVALPLDNSIIDGGMEVVTNSATELVLDCFFRVDEEKAGLIGGVIWVVEFEQPTFGKDTQNVVIIFLQRTEYRLFENDEVSPKLISAKVYDFDQYPANKVEVTNICLDREYVIVEVEKDATFTGAINFVATIYPGDEFGNTTIPVIEEEEQWLPAVQILPQLSTPKLDDVDIAFNGNFAAFRVNLSQLSPNQRYWITAIAYKQLPNYCPLGFIDDILISTNAIGVSLINWTATADPTNFINTILGDANYVGGLNVVKNNLVDSVGNEVGLGGNLFTGYQVTATKINLSYASIFYVMDIEALFDLGAGAHLIKHTLTVELLQPPVGAPVIYSTNTYQCNDLGG